MKTILTKSGKAVIWAICLLIACSLLVVFSVNGGVSAWAAGSEELEHEEKIYCNVTIEDNFDPSSVLVVMDKHTGGINKLHEPSFFGEFPKGTIKDLTYITGDVNSKKYLNKEEFHQILKIELLEKSKENVINVIRQLEKIDGIFFAGPNTRGSLDAQPTAANGTRYPDQWGLHGSYGINAESAWNITTGSTSIRVGVMDSGIANHPDLNANLVTGWDFVNNNSITNDDIVGHGTHVAGIIGATGANVDGVVGVSWNVQLVPLQITYDAFGHWDTDAAINAVTWAINHNIDILNFSAGTNNDYELLKNKLNNYTGLFVCSAGNNWNDNDDTPYYPSDYSRGQTFSDRVISVGASTDVGIKRVNSNYGANSVSLFAPGENIISTVPYSIDVSGYASWSDTSMAAPHVTGTAALMLSYIKTKPYSLEPKEISALIKSTIMDTVTTSSPLSIYCVSGGYLNAHQALYNLPFIGEVLNDFGYNGSTYYWNGKVEMTVDEYATACNFNSSNTMVISGNFMLDFELKTVSSHNAWSAINGDVTFQLKNSSDAIQQIEGSDSHVSTVNVSTSGTVSLGNKSFSINTLDLNNGTYTLTLTSDLDRASWNDTDIKTFTFIVDKPSLCIAEGTLITLADGSQKAVETLTMDDLLLVWNHHTGAFDLASMVFMDSDTSDAYEIIHLYFSDGTDVKVIYEHAFWNATLNKYVFIRDGEVTQYIGDWFNKQTYDINGNMIWENVQLVDVQIYTEQTTAWSPVTFSHLNFYVNGMLSMPGATEGLINIFEMDASTLQYNQTAFQADIQTYGLFTYEEFAEIIPIPEIIFEAFNGQYLKVSIGKGLIDINGLIALIESYAEFFEIEDVNDQNGNGNGNGNHNGHGNGNGNGNQNGHRNSNGGRGRRG